MLHPDPDAPRTTRSVLLTMLAALVIMGGMVQMAVEGDTAVVAMPEPEPPTVVEDVQLAQEIDEEHAPAALFPAGIAALSR